MKVSIESSTPFGIPEATNVRACLLWSNANDNMPTCNDSLEAALKKCGSPEASPV